MLLVSLSVLQVTAIRSQDPMPYGACERQHYYVLRAMKEETLEKFEETYAKSMLYGKECAKQKWMSDTLSRAVGVGGAGLLLVIINRLVQK